ncbi:MAG: hypothetical protein WC740_24815 [Verrucomicrobiia bacterium]
MNNLAWLKLLRAHCKEKDGLSLPFLVGGASYPTEANAKIEDAAAVLEQMESLDPAEGSVYLSVCARLQVPVFTLLPKGYGTGLRVGLNDTWGNTDAEKIQKVLTESKGPIASARFSRIQDNGIWCWAHFTDADKAFIASALQEE